MRSCLLVLLVAGLAAHAQPAASPAADSAPAPAPTPAPAPVAAVATDRICKLDGDCAAGQLCLKGYCGVPAPGATKGFFDSLVLGLGLGVWGEAFPYSSVNVPGSTKHQLCLLAGVRFLIGVQLPKRVRVMGLIQAGYASAGRGPGSASQGLAEGAGGEVALEYFELVQPFVRFTYNALVFAVTTHPSGTLAWSSFMGTAGARISIFELSVSVGRDFAGGISPGLGVGVGWMY